MNKMEKYKIIENFLPSPELIKLQNIFNSTQIDWYYIKDINTHVSKDALGVYFVHTAYEEGKASKFMHLFSSLLVRLDMKALVRIKVNLYPRTPKLETHTKHKDYNFPHTGAIFYLNTNNGKTILEDGTQISSIANRILLFDASTAHSSTSTTDSKVRLNINLNYK